MKLLLPKSLPFLFVLFAFHPVLASHIVGGEVTYVFMGDSTHGSTIYHNYKVSLSIYEDCLNGQPEAIAQDNPAFLGVFDLVTHSTYNIDTNLTYSSSISVPNVYSTPCGSVLNSGNVCLVKKTFVKTYALPSNTHGYVVAYERCCRNASIVNVSDPGRQGCTYYCTIPPTPVKNTSAVFKNYPPQTICLNVPLAYDHSATDADGDSLSYGFCAALYGANDADIKPLPYYPGWGDSVTYIAPYSSQQPFAGDPAIVIDPVTGVITGSPNKTGRYLVTVFCSEWRGGELINTIKREFQFVVLSGCNYNPYGPQVGPDTTIIVGQTVHFHASGGTRYLWTPSTYLSDPYIADPVGYFPTPGNFIYTVYETSDTSCNGTSTRTITVLDHTIFVVPNAFTPNGDGLNDVLMPIAAQVNVTLVSFKVFDRWGKMVYDGGPAAQGWDGFYRGVKQDFGVYCWELAYTDNTGVQRKMKGNATLIR